MATDSPHLVSRGEDQDPTPVLEKPPPWHLVLYGLAALSVFALAAVLFLDAKVDDFYSGSVAQTRVWANRQEDYSRLGKLATDLIEPTLSGSTHRDPGLESERLSLALGAFCTELDRARVNAQGSAVGTVRTALLDELHQIQKASEGVLNETEALLSASATGDVSKAREHADSLHRARDEVRNRIDELLQRTREIQRSNLFEQENAVRALLRVEEILVVVAAAIVGCVSLYGRRMWRKAAVAAQDKDRSEASLRESERRMRLILDTAYDAFVATDAEGRIMDWSARAEAVFGWQREETLGRDLAETIIPPEQRGAYRRDVEQYLREGRSSVLDRCLQIIALHRSGVLFPVEMVATAVSTDDGVVFSAFIRDITERKRAEEALRSSQERFELAVRGSSDGLWDWNVAEDELYLSPRCGELLRVRDLDAIKTLEAWLARVHPTDREGVSEALKSHLSQRVPFDVECRLRTGDEDPVWFRVRGQAVWNEAGEAVRMAGSITDITQHKRAIESLLRIQGIAEAKEQFEAQAAQLAAKTAELEQARAAAEAANRSKSEFLANMSHEIRTPMTAILGYSDLLANPSLSADERREGVQRIRQNGRHLLAVLNDILDLSKIEAGKMTVETIECPVHEIVTEIAALLRPRAVEKGLDLGVEFVGRVPSVIRSDPTRLRQILMNLIGNAIKFTEQGGVRIVAGMIPTTPQARPRLFVEVGDTGIGMSEDQVASLFKPFTQGDPSMARRFGGTGLGLTISRRLAEMLGGSISVNSKSGQGTNFRVEIETGPLEGVEMIIPIGGAELLSKDEPPPGYDVRASAGGECLLGGLRILLADDARDNRKIVSWHLRRAGATVDFAENGRIAMEKALQASGSGHGFDIVLMDMQMPELDGFAATRALREKGFERPIIALTAHAMTGDRDQCLAAGCNDYATKPIDPHELVLTLARWVASRPTVDDVAPPLPRQPEQAQTGEIADAKSESERESG